MNKSISVAIPVYNRAKWIGQTLEHILNQSVAVDEIIICDDGSTDDLERELLPFRDRIQFVQIANSGPAIARKTAIESASGNWIALCDSDDFWDQDHIQNFCGALTAHPEIDLYFSNFRQSDKEGITKFDQAPVNWLQGLSAIAPIVPGSAYSLCQQPFLGSLLTFQGCFTSCLIFRKDFYHEIGGIKDYVSRWASEDFHLAARMAGHGKAAIGLEPTVMINKHSGNFSSEYVKNIEGEVDILEDILEHDLVPKESLSLIAEQLTKFKVNLFRAYYWSSMNEEAVKLYRQIPRGELSVRDRVRVVAAAISSLI